MTPAQAQLLQANRRFDTTAGEGAVFGALAGALLGAATGGGRGAAIGAGVGLLAGGAAGYAVASKNLLQAHTEADLEQAIKEADADADAYESSANAAAQIVVDLQAEAAQFYRQYRAKSVPESEYGDMIATYVSSSHIMRDQIAAMLTETDTLRSDGRTYGITALKVVADRIDAARLRETLSLSVINSALSDCDPSRAGFLEGIGCIASGQYRARRSELNADVAESQARLAAEQAQARKRAAEPTAGASPIQGDPTAAEVGPPERDTLHGHEQISPLFPWPPPTASAWDVVPNEFIIDRRNATFTLSKVADHLKKVLDNAGYTQTSFYSIPGGFAIVTEMERINADATPVYNDRWRPIGEGKDFSIGTYLYGLLYADPGRFRIIVFAVSNQPFSPSSEPVTSTDAQRWTSHGVNVLPPAIGNQIYDADRYACTSLVYEFRTAPHSEPIFLRESMNPGRVHLERSMIWSSLAGSEVNQ